jgi:hypothetical protein
MEDRILGRGFDGELQELDRVRKPAVAKRLRRRLMHRLDVHSGRHGAQPTARISLPEDFPG